jgi:hypothetical protein
VIRIQGRAVVYGELWFDEKPPDTAGLAGVDVLVHRNCPALPPNAWPYRGEPPDRPLHSLQSDLIPAPEAIVARFDETCRRHVRRAERQDGLRHEVLGCASGGLAEFAEFYDAFARQKGLWLADRHWLGRAAEARQLVLSCASRDGERLVWHAHLCAGHTVQMTHSASLYRGMDDAQRSLVGRANRWLHWRDMLEFKSTGLRYYDWGGMFAPESTAEQAGINRFKRSFGGQPVIAWQYAAPVTIRGRLWLTIRGAWRRDAKRSSPAAASAA